ncbi:hypothetical protein EON66_03300 [archaeon]|nr:MAG: hypothetical protein EON66_03300 [archaeon]
MPCDLPSVWASLGWKCNTAYDKPAGPGGMSPGGAAALSIFIIALVAFLVWAVWALKMRRAPKWLVSAAAWLDNCWTGVKDRTRLNSMRARPIVFTSSSAAPIISSSSSGSGSDAERASILRG